MTFGDTVALDERVDAKQGWSTWCRRGDFQGCRDVGARCTNSKHGPTGQVPPPIGQRSKEAAMPRGIKGSGPYGQRESGSDGATSQRGPVVELEWEDPPPDLPVAVEPYVDVLNELQEKKGCWARIATFETKVGASGAARKLDKTLPTLNLGSYEFEARRNGHGSKLYAKFIGQGSR